MDATDKSEFKETPKIDFSGIKDDARGMGIALSWEALVLVLRGNLHSLETQQGLSIGLARDLAI